MALGWMICYTYEAVAIEKKAIIDFFTTPVGFVLSTAINEDFLECIRECLVQKDSNELNPKPYCIRILRNPSCAFVAYVVSFPTNTQTTDLVKNEVSWQSKRIR